MRRVIYIYIKYTGRNLVDNYKLLNPDLSFFIFFVIVYYFSYSENKDGTLVVVHAGARAYQSRNTIVFLLFL